jgi:hypothetical protein
MPGVIVKTAVRSGPAGEAAPAEGRYFVAGFTERGAVDEPIRVRSIAELEAATGGRVTYGAVYDDLVTYFSEGGGEAYVARLVGAAATAGTLSLVNRATTPLPTMAIDAASPGAWSTRLAVEVLDGGDPDTFTIRIYLDDELAETFENLTTPAYAAEIINARSVFINARTLGAATTGPTNNPAVMATTALSAGNDDRGAVTISTIAAALDRFGADYGPGAVAVPGYDSTAVGVILRNHAKAARRVALTATMQGATPEEAIDDATSLATSDGGEHVGLFWPWVRVPTADGLSRLISPEGFVAACRARASRTDGPWRTPAGDIAIASYVLGVETEVPRSVAETLDDEKVSVIRAMAGTVRLYGWRSLSTDTGNFAMLTARDTLNLVAAEAEKRLEQFVFQTIDGRGYLFSQVESELVGLLDPLRVRGGLYERVDEAGEQIDPGYSVDVGPAVNTPVVLARNEVRANVGIRVSPVGQLIVVTVTKAALSAAV